MSDINNDKLGALVGKMLGDLGGAFSVPTVRIGFRLGLFDALHRHGAARISELAERTGLTERYVREWAFAQAANGYIAFDAQQEQFNLTPEQAMVFANKESPVYLPSIEQANSHTKAHGLADRVRFVTAPAKDITDRDFDLVTMFDCLHDMGDPRGCAKHVRKLLKPSGSWMIVEPIAADHPSANIGNPVSQLYYNASTMICVPTSLAQEVGEALGAQAGEAKLTEVLKEGGGFRHVRRAAQGPFNMVLEARP